MPKSPWRHASDCELLDACRDGATDAFSALWDRHRFAARKAATNLAPSLDADDLVSEAYLKIFELVVDGRGPRGAFRPYLYQVIRTVAVDRYRTPEQTSAELDAIPDDNETAPWEDQSFDLDATAEAFATLDERWQAALWYSEVEGLPPRHAAPLLGLSSANAASALMVRAREGLQSAWVEAHFKRESAQDDCRETLDRLQRFQRGKLTSRAAREVAAHLDDCEGCAAAAAEALTLNRRLGLVLAGILLGSVGTGALLTKLGFGTAANAGAAVALGSATAAGSSSATTSGSGAAASSGTATGGAGSGGSFALPIALVSGLTVTAVAVTGLTVAAASGILTPADTGSSITVAAPNASEGDSDTSLPDTVESTPKEATTVAPADPEDADPSGSDPDDPNLTDDPVPPANPDPEPRKDPKPPAPKPDPPKPPKPDPPVTPKPPTGLDTSLSPGFGCTVVQTDSGGPIGIYLSGQANNYGLIRLRITPLGGAPIQVFAPQFDPAQAGIAPGNVFVNSVFNDAFGNRFTRGFFALPASDTDTRWVSSTSLLDAGHDAGLSTVDLMRARVEIRLVAPDGRYSAWAEVDLIDDFCI